ncbi:hypothetical protein CCU22_00455 [Candidatus Legionella polyplacis]|uniref:signal peptidase II n=1 Tax=Candidatus Legionella polyplacis TaxID=2005262 RepID=UPI000C1F1DD8|nr:hypothetical protein CCU22_00455 [Candidatus Legionella polyplacis]
MHSLSISLIIGGGISNFYDRIRFGYVIDYVYINYDKNHNLVLNVADICIFVGIIILCIMFIINKY